MTPDELRNLLMSGETEGADRAGIYNKAIEAYTVAINDLAELKTKNETLTNQVGTLTDSNFKLLEKIRYTDNDNGNNSDNDTLPEITLSNLFEEG